MFFYASFLCDNCRVFLGSLVVFFIEWLVVAWILFLWMINDCSINNFTWCFILSFWSNKKPPKLINSSFLFPKLIIVSLAFLWRKILTFSNQVLVFITCLDLYSSKLMQSKCCKQFYSSGCFLSNWNFKCSVFGNLRSISLSNMVLERAKKLAATLHLVTDWFCNSVQQESLNLLLCT